VSRRAAAVLLAISLSLAGCVGGGTRPAGNARQGGSITIATGAPPDTLDPALAATPDAQQALWLAYTAPLAYRRAEGQPGTTPVPALAERLPRISDAGRVYSFRLRAGLEYPGGRPVRASDFVHAVKRVLLLDSPGARLFDGVVEARAYARRGDPRASLPGVRADDRSREVEIRLERPDPAFLGVLATTYAGIVPASTPFRDTSAHPPPGVGPYVIARHPGDTGFVMRRRRRFRLPGVPGGNLDEIRVAVVSRSARRTRGVIRGRYDSMQGAPPLPLLPLVRSQYEDRYSEHATDVVDLAFLDVRRRPFADTLVRRAVNEAIDGTKVERLSLGMLEPTCNLLPPSVLGYHKLDPCPYGNPTAPADLVKASRLVQAAGAEGARVTVWGDDEGAVPAMTRYLASTLRGLGLDARARILPASEYRAALARGRPQAGVVRLGGEVPSPSEYFAAVDGNSVGSPDSLDFGRVRDAQLDTALRELRAEPLTKRVDERWAELDKLVVDRGYLVPLGVEKRGTFLSERLDFENCNRFSPVYGSDWSSFCLK
jgi:peptide/nickel transport system substrate-binding protein